MKKILSITLLLLALTAGYASAQTKTDDRKAKREQLANSQARSCESRDSQSKHAAKAFHDGEPQ